MIDKRNEQWRESAPCVMPAKSRTEGDDLLPGPPGRSAHALDVRVRAVDMLMIVEFMNPQVLFENGAVQELAAHLERLVGEGHVRLVLDLSSVRYASSGIVTLVAWLYQKVNAAGGSLRLFGLDPVLRDAIRICRLDRVVEVYVDEAKAIENSRSIVN